MIRPTILPLLGLFLLAACGGGGSDEGNREQLERAAEQSDPAAAEVLENAAETGVPVQEALEQAGNAQAATVIRDQPQTPPSQGAKPHAAGDPVPPPQVPADTQ